MRLLELHRSFADRGGSSAEEAFKAAAAIGQELVLAHLQADNVAAAQALLHELAAELGAPDEESLCRWGRLFKDHADALLPKGNDSAGSADSALGFYLKSIDKYDEAFQLRRGHYPGINKASLLLIVASLCKHESRHAQLRNDSRQLADELLASRARWPKQQDDDDVWHWATEGEAHALLERWDRAAACCRRALDEPCCQQFHAGSMSKQLMRILEALRQLQIADFGPLNDLPALFKSRERIGQSAGG